MMAVCVIGAGSWGTALAMVLARHGREVRLLARDAAKAKLMQEARGNAAYLPGVSFPASLHVTASADDALREVGAVVVATPCSTANEVLPLAAGAGSGPIIAAFKGLDPLSLERVDQMMLRHAGAGRAAILSGPSFASEVARGLPTAITMAATDLELARRAGTFFDDNAFRIYSSDDMTGVALGGALKNVIAIAAGVAAGLQLGHNAESALVTRGLAELMRLAKAAGARRETLMGLSGLGDLVLTCTGELSRNRRLGMALATGSDPDEAQAQIGQVVEGVRTAAAAHSMAESLGVDAPLMEIVHRILLKEIDATTAVNRLLARPERSEF